MNLVRIIIGVLVAVAIACSPEPELPQLLTTWDDQALKISDPEKDCVECHPNHVAEWRISPHAYSGRDPAFIAMTKLAQAQSLGKVGQFCVQCHMPVAALTQTVPTLFNDVTRRYEQDVVDLPPLVKKGVTCDICHSIAEVVETRNARLVLATDGKLRGPIADPVPNTFHQSKHDASYSESIVCSSCHAVVNGKGALIEQTFDEWQFSGFAARGETCQSCHMPAYEGQAAKGGPTRTVHRHHFVGVDVSLLPEDEFPGYHEMRELVTQLLRTAADFRATAEPESASIKIEIENKAGHSLPSGATADRQVWVEMIVRDEAGDVVFETGTLDERGDLRDAVAKHNLEPGTDPQLIFFGQFLLKVPALTAATTDEEKARIRARVTAACLPVGVGVVTDDVEAKAVMFPWAADWQCNHLIAPEATASRSYDLSMLPPGRYSADLRLLYRTFPPFVLRTLEELAGMDPAVKERLPTVTMATQQLNFELP